MVLVIEDEEAIRRLIQGTLEGEGYRVLAARSAEDAIVALVQATPGLILLDLNLPGMDGFAFINAYHDQKDPMDAAPIIIVSSVRPRDALPEGVVGYLRKPFELDDLLARVERTVSPD